MKILYYDCFCGISGDMNLGALVDLGVNGEFLVQELLKLRIDSEYEIRINKTLKMGISGTKVDVILKNNCHDHHRQLEEYHHDETGFQAKNAYEHHHHRNLHDIANIINCSGLNDRVKRLSLEMFAKVAEAEAKVHNKPIEEVHFHEIGATDSIIDMVGAAIALDCLNVDKIMASSVQVGGGFVKCAHGLFPVPAPATIELLAGIPIKLGIVPFETTTPTGAAILRTNVDEFTDKMEFSVEKTGYGIGNRDFDEVPNVLRVYLGNTSDREMDHEAKPILG